MLTLMPDDNYARQTNHDYIGSFGRIPNEPKTKRQRNTPSPALLKIQRPSFIWSISFLWASIPQPFRLWFPLNVWHSYSSAIFFCLCMKRKKKIWDVRTWTNKNQIFALTHGSMHCFTGDFSKCKLYSVHLVNVSDINPMLIFLH